jgi:agmatinase
MYPVFFVKNTMTDEIAAPYTFFGITTFGKVHHARLVDDWDADAAIVGVPFDLGVGFRSGARIGPKAIRDISERYRLKGSKHG